MPPPTAKQLETRLGFNFRYLARDPRAEKTPETSQLLQRVNILNKRYVSYGIKKIRSSNDIRLQILEILDALGPKLWPDFDKAGKRKTPWLLDPSDTTEYTRHLVFSDSIDCTTIRETFRVYVEQAILRYHSNHRKRAGNQHPPYEPPESDFNTDPEESEADEDAGDGEKDTQSDYCPSKPSSIQSFDSTPRCGDRDKNMNSYAAPTAPMIPEPSAMGNVPSMLESADLSSNRATQSMYQKEFLTSQDLRARGRKSRPAPASASAPGISPNINLNSSTRESPGNPTRPDDQSIRVQPRSASKRIRSADSEAEASPKRSKNTEKVLRPKPQRLIVVLKLTREKMSQGGHHQCSGEQSNTPAPLNTSHWPNGPLASCKSPVQRHGLPPAQECHVPSPALESLERENMATPSPQDHFDQHQGSDEAVDTPAANTPAPYTHGAVTEDANGDATRQEEHLPNLQESEYHDNQQNAAVNTSGTSSVGAQAHVEQQAHTLMKNNGIGNPVAIPTQASNDGNDHSIVPEANPAPVRVDQSSAFTQPVNNVYPSLEIMQSTENVFMFASLKREGHDESNMFSIAFQDFVSGDDVFKSLREAIRDRLGEDMEIMEANMKRTSEPDIPELSRKYTDFWMMEAQKVNNSWQTLLRGLVISYKKQKIPVELELTVCLRVGKVSDKKQAT